MLILKLSHVSSGQDTWYLGRLTMDSDEFETCRYGGRNKCISKYNFTWDDGVYLNEKIREENEKINLWFEVDETLNKDDAIRVGCTLFGNSGEVRGADNPRWHLM